MGQLREIQFGQLRGLHSGRLGMQKVVQQHPVQTWLEPDLHTAGDRPGDRPSNAQRAAIFDHLEPQIGPPPPPAGGIAHRGADERRIGGDEHLVGNLNAGHVS
jgi:hypothetical protein